jgi:hypothetical protein
MKVACMAVVMCMMAVSTTQAPVYPICGQLNLTLGDYCLDHLTGGVKDPSSLCCDGVKELSTGANTTAICQHACNSAKYIAMHTSNFNNLRGSGLGHRCDTLIPFPISSNADCAM